MFYLPNERESNFIKFHFIEIKKEFSLDKTNGTAMHLINSFWIR